MQWELTFNHEFIHTDGLVASCAPNIAEDLIHVIDDPRDIMYIGDEEWKPQFVDINNHDYFKHSNDNCPDLIDSNYIKPRQTLYTLENILSTIIFTSIVIILVIFIKRLRMRKQIRNQIEALK